MRYQRITDIVKNSLPKDRALILSKKQLENYKNLSHIALAVLLASGVMAISLVAPNILIALKPLLKKRNKGWVKDKPDYKEVVKVFGYLKRHGLIKIKPKENDYEISVTSEGRNMLLQADFNSLKVEKKEKWDGCWWQIAADIPTQTHRAGADLFRRKLKKMGFFALQKSLWFYPFDPRRELQLVCDHYGLGQYVTVMEINRMDTEDEKKLMDYFKHQKII